MHLLKKAATYLCVASVATIISINFSCNNFSSSNPTNSNTTSAAVEQDALSSFGENRLLSVANVYSTKNNTFEVWFFETPVVFEFSAKDPNAKKYFDLLLKAKNNASQKQVSVRLEKNSENRIASISEGTPDQIAAFNKMAAARDKSIPTEMPDPAINPAATPKAGVSSLTGVIPSTGVLNQIFSTLRAQCCVSPTNVLVTNDVFAVRTTSGNYAKVRVTGPFDNSQNHGLPIQWVTYRTNGTVASSGSRVIPGTYTFDLDAGVLSGAGADIWWQQMTSTTRQVSRNNTATITNRGVVDFNSITVSQLQSYAYSTTPINGSDPGPFLYGQCIPFQYVADGCYARAHKMRQVIEDYYGYTSYKVFNFSCDGAGTLAASATLWGNNCCVRWWYHVTSYVMVQVGSSQVAYALDPAMFTAPVTLATWIAAQKSTSCGYGGASQGQAYYTSNAYSPISRSNCSIVPGADNGYTAANSTCNAYSGKRGCLYY